MKEVHLGASGAVQNVNPSEIRFSQTSVNGSEEIISSMKANGWKGDPIDVVRMPDGNLTTIDVGRSSGFKNTEAKGKLQK